MLLRQNWRKISIGLCLSLLAACGSRQVQLDAAEERGAIAAPQASELKTSGETVRFGVLAIDSAGSVNERYKPLLDYLSAKIGRSFQLVPLSQESQFTEVAQGNLDFTTNNPLAATQIRRLHQTRFLVTHVRPQTGTQFSGLIIAHGNSGIESLEDLRGKRASCVAFQTAAAGCVFQIYHLRKNGINPFIDFSSFEENRSQDNIVLAVLNGSIDVGFIRTGQLEKMQDKGLIGNLDEIKIIDASTDDFFYPHTTELYPEWPVAALSTTHPELMTAVERALLEIPPNHPALTALRAKGFTTAVDYSKLDELIETLRLRSWEAKADAADSKQI